MSQKEKLSRFKRMLGGIGKRVYNWRETKESMNFLSYMYESIIWEYADIFDGDYEKAMDTLIELIRPMTEEVTTKLLLEVKVMGVAFKSLLSPNLSDIPYIIQTSLYAVYGGWSKKMYKKPVVVPAEFSSENVPTVIVQFTSCPFCCNTVIPAEKFGKHRYGRLHVLTIEQITQAVEDYVGNDYHVVGREVKCFHNGDDIGEIRLWLYPRDQLDLMESNEYLKKIK